MSGRKYLADWDLALKHQKASSLGRDSKNIDDPQNKTCKCCLQQINKEPIPLCENTKQLQFLGYGFPLYFMFLRNCMMLILLLIVTNSLISIYISARQGHQACKNYQPNSVVTAQMHYISLRNLEHTVETTAGHTVETTAGHTVETTAGHTVETTAGHTVETTAGHTVETTAGHTVETTAGTDVQGDKSTKDEEDEQRQANMLKNMCTNWMVLVARTDIVNRDEEFIYRIASMVIQMIALLYIKDKILKTLDYYDQRQCDISDYSLMFKGLPEQMGMKNKMIKLIETVNQPDTVATVIAIPDYDDILPIKEEMEVKIKEHLFKQAEGKDGPSDSLDRLKRLTQLENSMLSQVEVKIRKLNSDRLPFDTCIVIFHSERNKIDFQEKFREVGQVHTESIFGVENNSILMEQAPEPREIIWENIKYESTRKYSILLGWTLSILFLIVIWIVYFYLQELKSKFIESSMHSNADPDKAYADEVKAIVVALLTFFGVIMFNKFVMGNVLSYFTKLEHHDHVDYFQFSFASKYAFGMLFTTALMTIVVEAIQQRNYYSQRFGVIEEETIMFIFCAVFLPLIWLINPFQQMTEFRRRKNFQNPTLTQKQANHLMQNYHYDIGKRYAEIIEMMWFTFLYADLIPVGSFMILFGLFAYYWIDKYNLLRRSSLQGNISGDLAVRMLTLLDLTLFFRNLGQFIFDTQIHNGAKLDTIFELLLAIIYVALPWGTIINYVNEENFYLNKNPYNQAKKNFRNTYYSQHPVYSQMLKIERRRISGQVFTFLNDEFINHTKTIS